MEDIYITHEKIEDYCIQHTSPPSAAQAALIPATREFVPSAYHMQVGPLEGKFLSLITRLMNAKNVLEFGTFTGYSALAFAESLPNGGKVTTLDRDQRVTDFAKTFWKESGLDSKIEFLLGDAHQTIHALEKEILNHSRPLYDLAFIDADKAGYPLYWETALKLVRKGGAILVDNVLWSGAALNPVEPSDHIITNFNTMVLNDPRVEKIMIPLRDGIYLARIL